jgi:hypothetical protein
MTESLEFYLQNSNHPKGLYQSKIVDEILNKEFNFSYVECIETGVSYGGNDDNFGVYLAKFTQSFNGKMSSVDIDKQRVDASQTFINEHVKGIDYKSYSLDSVEFLKNYKGNPNLVHLDSYDLDIPNPLPSMLHHWLEFVEIESKMPSGSILLVDDNFFRGTTVYWNTLDGEGNITKTEPIDIIYEIVGKGSLIYHAIKEKKINNWVLVGGHYHAGPNQKLIFKKL